MANLPAGRQDQRLTVHRGCSSTHFAISGWARIMATPAGVAGRVVQGRFIGTATFADDSQMPLEAELAADGQTLVVHGGLECRMERR